MGTFYMDAPSVCGGPVEVAGSNGVGISNQVLDIFYVVWENGEVLSYNRISEIQATWVLDASGNASTSLVGTNVINGDATISTPISVSIDNLDGTPVTSPLATTDSVMVTITTVNPTAHTLQMIYGCEIPAAHTGEVCSGCAPSSTCVVYYNFPDSLGDGGNPPVDRVVSDTSLNPAGDRCITEAMLGLAAPQGSASWTIFAQVGMEFGTAQAAEEIAAELLTAVNRNLLQASEVGGPLSSSGSVTLETDEIAFETYTNDERTAFLVVACISFVAHAMIALRMSCIHSGWKGDVPLVFLLLLLVGFVIALTEVSVAFTEVFAISIVTAPAALVILLLAYKLWGMKGPGKGMEGVEMLPSHEGGEDDHDVFEAILTHSGMPVPQDREFKHSGGIFDRVTEAILATLGISSDESDPAQQQFDRGVKGAREGKKPPSISILTMTHHMPSEGDIKRIAQALSLLTSMGEGSKESAVKVSKNPTNSSNPSSRVKGFEMVRCEDKKKSLRMPPGILVRGNRAYSRGLDFPQSVGLLDFALTKGEGFPGMDPSTQMTPMILPQVVEGEPGQFYSYSDWSHLLCRVCTLMANTLAHLDGFKRVRMSDMKVVIVWGRRDECSYHEANGVTTVYLTPDAVSALHEFGHAAFLAMFPQLRKRPHEGSARRFSEFFLGNTTAAELIAQVRRDLSQEAKDGVRHFNDGEWVKDQAPPDSGTGTALATFEGKDYLVKVTDGKCTLMNTGRIPDFDDSPSWLVRLSGRAKQPAPGAVPAASLSYAELLAGLDLGSEDIEVKASVDLLAPLVHDLGEPYVAAMCRMAAERCNHPRTIAREVALAASEGKGMATRFGLKKRSPAQRIPIESMAAIVNKGVRVHAFQLFGYCEYKAWSELISEFSVDAHGEVATGDGDLQAFFSLHQKWIEFQWNRPVVKAQAPARPQQGGGGGMTTAEVIAWLAKLGLTKATQATWTKTFSAAPKGVTASALKRAVRATLTDSSRIRVVTQTGTVGIKSK